MVRDSSDFAVPDLHQTSQRLPIGGHTHHHAPSITVQDADTNFDFPVERLLKTIAFRVKNRGWVLAGILGYDRVDYRRLIGDAHAMETSVYGGRYQRAILYCNR